MLFFFFFSFVAPLYFHSFPTRRSSDLGGVFYSNYDPLVPKSPFFARLFDSFDTTVGKVLYDPADILDRKSTRLNSSHRCISYAVFCLKKKKKKNNIELTKTLKIISS